jgi:transcriptional regulator with XRE-family HTH domain
MWLTYGERLKKAMLRRGEALGRVITRKELSQAAGCSVQNIGMILTNAKGKDQKLSTESHAKAAAFLKVDPDWLLNEVGDIEPKSQTNAPTELTSAAVEIAVLFDMIPVSDRIRRAQAFNSATAEIMRVLQSAGASEPASPNPEKPPV